MPDAVGDRTNIGEALRLVEVRAGQGIFVASFLWGAGNDLSLVAAALEKKPLLHLAEVRRISESEVIGLVAARATNQRVETLN